MLCTAWEKTSAYCVGRKPLERWQSVGLGGCKKVSDSVPIFFDYFCLKPHGLKNLKVLKSRKKPKGNVETYLPPTGGNILPFFWADVEGRRENGLKNAKRCAPKPSQ